MAGRQAGGVSGGALSRVWLWLMLLGLAFVVVGLVAIVHPLTASLVALAWLGALFAVAGLAQLLQVWTAAGWRGSAWHIGSGAVYLLGGLVMLFDPFAGAVAAVLVLAATLLVSGALRTLAGVALRPEPGWLWVLVGGLAGLAAGAALVALPPGQSVLIPGLIVGAAFLCEGLMLVSLARLVRRV